MMTQLSQWNAQNSNLLGTQVVLVWAQKKRKSYIALFAIYIFFYLVKGNGPTAHIDLFKNFN